MNRETKKVLTAVALIVATGIAAVETTRAPAFADSTLVAGGAAGYAGSRIDHAFQAVADMPPMPAVSIPMAVKGDLTPLGCIGPFRDDVAAECTDTAYEVESNPYVVVETRGTASSILTRMMQYTVAGIDDQVQQSQ